MGALVIGAIVVVGTAILLTGNGGKVKTLFSGFTNLFIENVAKTPEGANAIYTEAIEEAGRDYAKADNVLRKVSGMLNTATTKKNEAEERLVQVKKKCELLVKENKIQQAETYAMQLAELEEDIELQKAEINRLTPMLSDSKNNHAQLEAKLQKLKKEKRTVVKQMEINKQTKELYDDLNELKNTKNTSKLLDDVKSGLLDSNEMVYGAKSIHENKTSTKISRIENELKGTQSSAYIEELKKKYNK